MSSSPRSPDFQNPNFLSGGLPLSLHDHANSPRDSAGRSIISSRMTDVSENESDIMGLAEAQQSQNVSSPRNSLRFPSHLGRPTKRVSVGSTVQHDSSRPTTAMSTSTVGQRQWGTTSSSRRGASVSNSRNRPASAASKTHAPSLPSQAFYRPMSSAKLQAQRGKVTEEDEAEQNRIRGFAQAASMHDVPVRTSYQQRTEMHSPREASVSTVDNTLRNEPSINSASPLHESRSSTDIRRHHNDLIVRMPQHRDLSSAGSQSSITRQKHAQPKLGKNYEYFPGNMSFCFGGRWQTANDMPMNVLTGILVTLPSALFFAYS